MSGCGQSRCMLLLGMEKTPAEQWCDELRGLLGRRKFATRRAARLLEVLNLYFYTDIQWTSLAHVAQQLNWNGSTTARRKIWSRTQVMRLLAIGEEQDIDPVHFDRIKDWIVRQDKESPRQQRGDRANAIYDSIVERTAALKVAYRAQAKVAKDLQFDIRRVVSYNKA